MTTTARTIEINGTATAMPAGAIAWKYADPTEDARWIYDGTDLAAIEAEDPSLIERPAAHIADEQIRELCILTTRDEAGRHFTTWSEHYEALEIAGLIAIHRPVHEATGIAYAEDHWSIEITEDGQDLIDANPELHPA